MVSLIVLALLLGAAGFFVWVIGSDPDEGPDWDYINALPPEDREDY
jgi:hypothetical protein